MKALDPLELYLETVAGFNVGAEIPLEEQPVLLTPEPSLQLCG